MRYRDIHRTVLGAYSEAPLDEDLDNIVTAKYITQKYSYQANNAHRFIFFNLWERLRENAKMDSLRSWEAREDKKTAHPIIKGGWEGQFGNAIAANFQFGYAPHDSLAPFLNTGTPQEIGRTDLVNEMVTGENVVCGERSRHFLHQTKGAMTYYKPNWAGGNHEIKVGGEHARTKNFRSLDLKPVNYHLRYDGCEVNCAKGGVPFDVVFFNAPVYPDGRQHTTSFFARDSWTIGRRLTLNLGARFASVAAFAPEQTRDAASGPSAPLFPAQTFPRVDLNTWNSFEPRLHAAFDVSGDGKTVVKGGFGRYHHMRLLTPDVLNFVKNSITYSIYQWRDLNGNNDYDDGETDLNPTGPDFLEQTGMEFDDLPPNFVNNPDEKQPRTDEWSLSLERELIANFAIRVTGLYTRSTDIFRVQSFLQPYDSFNIPVTNRDPGPDGELGTGDDGGLVTYHEFAPELTGAGNAAELQRPESRAADLQEHRDRGRQAAREPLVVHGLLLGHEEEQADQCRVGGRRVRQLQHGPRGRGLQSQRGNLPGRQYLGLGQQAAGVLQLPGRRDAVVELPSSERRSVRPAGAFRGRRDHSGYRAERGGDRRPIACRVSTS